MEHQPWGRVGIAVEPISENRASEPAPMCGVHAELVSPAGPGHELDARAVGLAGKNAPVGDRGAALRVIDDLAGTVGDVGAERLVDAAGVGGHVALHECDVRLLDLSGLELHGQ